MLGLSEAEKQAADQAASSINNKSVRRLSPSIIVRTISPYISVPLVYSNS